MIVTLRREYGQLITSGAQLLLLVIGLQTQSRTGWLTCLGLMAGVSLIAWVSALHRRRAITDTPTSRIASAAQGYVELAGQGRGLDYPPLLAPLTHAPCLWYRYRVEEHTAKDKWQTVDSGESNAAFILDDGSGRCVVDVEGAEILTRHKKSWNSGDYRHTEWLLRLDDPIFALGDFRTLGGSTVELDARQDMTLLLAEWKKNQGELLHRFDLDNDGSLSLKEWELARQAARREVARLHREARNEADVNTLRRPATGQIYLLSNIDPDKLARRYLWWAAFHLAVFFGALAALPVIWRQPY